ncbi:MAG: hypothetical protein R6V52_09405 [Bacteroidales bacterium]
MNTLSKKIISLAEPVSIRRILLFTIIFIFTELVFSMLIIPAVKASSGGYGILDSLFMADKAHYRSLMNAYTSETRLLHYVSSSLDMLFPLIYGGLMAMLLIRCVGNKRWLSPALLLVLITVVADYLENAGILFFISMHREAGEGVISYLQITSNLKFIFLGFSILITGFAIGRSLFSQKKKGVKQ